MSYGFNLGGQTSEPTAPTKGAYGFSLGNAGPVVDSPLAKLHVLSQSIGGGAFKTMPGKEGQPVLEGHTTYGGMKPAAGQERDDIIPVALGGTNQSPANMRYEQMLSKGDQKPGVLTPTDEAELQQIHDYKSGKISLAEARANVLHVKQQQTGLAPTEKEQTTAGQYPSALLDTGEKISSGFMDAMGWVGDKITKGVAGAIGTFPTMLASGGKKTLAQSFQDSPDFIHKMVTEPFNVAEEMNPELSKNVSFQFGREFVKGLTDAGLQTAGALALDAIGSRIATAKTKISVSPEQMKDLMTGREPQGALLSPEDKATVMKEFLKPDTQKEIVKQANQEGLTISKSAPASPARQFVGQILGGGPEGEKTTVEVGGKVVKPETPMQKLHAETQKAVAEPSLSPEQQAKKDFAELQQKVQGERPQKIASETALDLHKKSVQAENDYRVWLKEQPEAQKAIKDIQEKYDTIPLSQDKARADFLKNEKLKLDTKFSKIYAETLSEKPPKVQETPVSEKPPQVPPGQQPSKIAKSIEAKAIEAKLTKGFSGVAGYTPATFKEQAEKASEVINSGLDRLTKVVSGEEKLPEGLREAPFIASVEEYLKKNPNIDLQHALANSPLTSETSYQAQGISLARMREKDSASAALAEIKKTMVQKVQKTDTGKIKSRIKSETSKIHLSKEEQSWDKFLNDIAC